MDLFAWLLLVFFVIVGLPQLVRYYTGSGTAFGYSLMVFSGFIVALCVAYLWGGLRLGC